MGGADDMDVGMGGGPPLAKQKDAPLATTPTAARSSSNNITPSPLDAGFMAAAQRGRVSKRRRTNEEGGMEGPLRHASVTPLGSPIGAVADLARDASGRVAEDAADAEEKARSAAAAKESRIIRITRRRALALGSPPPK